MDYKMFQPKTSTSTIEKIIKKINSTSQAKTIDVSNYRQICRCAWTNVPNSNRVCQANKKLKKQYTQRNNVTISKCRFENADVYSRSPTVEVTNLFWGSSLSSRLKVYVSKNWRNKSKRINKGRFYEISGRCSNQFLSNYLLKFFELTKRTWNSSKI